MSQTLAHSLDGGTRTEDILIEERYNFDSLLLSSPISRGLKDAGFYKPSPIQLKAIPLGRCGLDLIVKAKSGTGKTAVFTIIALEMVKASKNTLQVLIFAPTREIAVQIHDVIQTIGKEIKGLRVSLFIGGLPIERDIEQAKSCHIAVGAPGRLKHLVEKGHLNTSSIRLLIFDEADKLMEECFQNDVNYIYHKLPERKQVIALSATYQDELKKFLERYMLSPTFVSFEVDNSILLGLRQFVTLVKESSNVVQLMKSKTEELLSLLSKVSFTQCLVFCNFQQRTESISNLLNRKGWNSIYISAAQTQIERLKSYNTLKKFQCRILLSTDLTARGIDASNVDLVINYDVPYEAATYLHRMGRAGRYGSRGLCITIAADGKELKELQSILGEIGGSGLSIAKLPGGEKLVADIWECDLNSFENVYGAVDADTDAQNKKLALKNSVLELKNEKSKNEDDTVSKGLKKLSMDESTGLEHEQVENIKRLLNSKQKVSDQHLEIHSESLLNDLASGKSFDMETNERESLSELENIKNMLNGKQSTQKFSDEYLEMDSKSLLESLASGKSFEIETNEKQSQLELENITHVLINNQKMQKVSDKYSDIDSESLLESLASGKSFEIETNEKQSQLELENIKHVLTNNQEMQKVSDKYSDIESESLLEILASGKSFEIETNEKQSQLELENIKHVLTNNKKMQKVSGKYSDIDSESLLETLASGKSFEIETNESHISTSVENSREGENNEMDDIINPALMYPWIPVEVPVLSKSNNAMNLLDSSDDAQQSDDEEFTASHTDGKKRKRNQRLNLKSTNNQCANNEELKKKYILCKNTALFNITKLLTNNNLEDLDENISYVISPLRNYLCSMQESNQSISDQMQTFFWENSNEDLLENVVHHIERWVQACECKQANEYIDPEENIFKLAYDAQLWDGIHWTVALGDKYVEEEEEVEQEMEVEIEQEDVYEDATEWQADNRSSSRAGNDHINVMQRESENKHYSYNDSVWTNSAPSGSVGGYFNVDHSHNQAFGSHFNFYSQQLANDALTFEDVPSFDNWFEQWQLQVGSVRDYVQQNIYLQEMNNYQQSRQSYFHYLYGTSDHRNN